MERTLPQTDPVLGDPDVQLMLRVKRGDHAAFTELVVNYQERLVGVLAHVLENREGAEDVAQEVFMRIFRARHSYEPTARFSTWLFRIANNLAKNLRRDTARRRETALNTSEAGPHGVRPYERMLTDKSGFLPTRVTERDEMHSVVHAALGTLTEPQRTAMVLNKFEEMSYTEIATALELTPSAVKSLLTRAREALRERLEPYVQRGVLRVFQSA